MKKGIIVIDADKCLSCKSCEIACYVNRTVTKNLYGAIKETSISKGIFIENIPDKKNKFGLSVSVPLQCRHCEDAPCIKVCPTKALKRTNDDSPVLIDNELCIGCKECVMVCPFGVITFDTRKKAVIKCDLCIERLKNDDVPACVAACPTKCIKFESIEKLTKGKRKKYLVEMCEK